MARRGACRGGTTGDITIGVEVTTADGADFETATESFVLTVEAGNDGPVTDAGADQVVDEGDTVQLAGSATDADEGDLF